MRAGRIRTSLVAGFLGAFAYLAMSAPAQAVECTPYTNPCQPVLLTVCVVLQKVTHEYNCQ